MHTVAYVVTRFLKQQPANISSGRCRVIAMGEVVRERVRTENDVPAFCVRERRTGEHVSY